MVFDERRLAPSAAYRLPNAPTATLLGGQESTAPQLRLPLLPLKIDAGRLWKLKAAPAGGAVQQTPQGGAVTAPAPVTTKPELPVTTPPPVITKPPPVITTPPTTPIVPDMGLSIWQKQKQQQYVQQTVSVPVSVQASPTTSITIAPPRPSDYGPMVPPDVAAGMEAYSLNRCLLFGALGALAALIMRK